MFDIEGHLLDTKTYDFPNQDRGGEIRAGEPLHNMFIRITLDCEFMIRAVEVSMDDTPFIVCRDIEPAFKALEGVKIAPGWTRAVRQKLGGTRGCTHIVEMMPGIATVAFQTLGPALRRMSGSGAGTEDSENKKPAQIDGCHALASDGAVVKRRWPQFYTGTDS